MSVAQPIPDFRARRRATVEQSTTTFACEPDFDFRSSQFLRLFQNSTATAFQHPLWLDAFYRLIVPHRGAEKLVVTGRDSETGMLRFVLPFVTREANLLTLIETADLGVSDYAAPIVSRDWRIPSTTREDVAEVLPVHDLMRVRPVRSDTIDAWRAFIDGDAHTLDFFGPATELSGPFPDWRSGDLGQDYRKPLHTETRRLKCGASSLYLLTDSADIANAMESIRVQRMGRFQADQIQEKKVLEFYISLAVAGRGSDFARTYAILEGDETIGHVFGITWNGRFHYLLIGCDFERHGSHTASLILHDTMVEDWMTHDASVFDFTIGDEAFKQNAGKKAAEMFVLTKAPTWRGRLARSAFDATEHVERMQRGTIVN